MSKGYVYILSNQYMPGLVKIGKTTRSVEGRASELYQTGVPAPFEVEHDVFSPDCTVLEMAMHEAFRDRRTSAGREFFKVEVEKACSKLEDLLKNQVGVWVKEFIPFHDVVSEHEILAPKLLGGMSEALGISTADVMLALHDMSPEELIPSVRRVLKWQDEHPRSGATDGREVMQ